VALHVSVDFGTSSTCTVAAVDAAEPQVVVIDGQPLLPSAVFAAVDGTLFVGQEAERHAAVDPSRFEPHPKRRIDEGSLLLGSSVLKVGDVVRAVLQRTVGEARRHAAGATVDLLVLTHPADWGNVRVRELRNAASGLAKELVMVPEPVAAAVFHSAGHSIPDGGALAVFDLGGGTVDASVVRRQGSSFAVLATRGDPNFGGADIDQILLDHVGRSVSDTDRQDWTRLIEGRELSDRRRRRMLRQDVRGAKETLSRHAYTDVPMPTPFSDVHVTRADLERLILEPLTSAADLVLATLRDAAVPRAQLAGVFLVGGSSRIPLVSRLVHERTGIVPTTLDQPETVVARGALRTVLSDPQRAVSVMPTRRTTPPPLAAAGPPGGAKAPAVVVAPEDSLSRASTIVIGGNQETVVASPPRRRSRRIVWLAAGCAVLLVVAALTAFLLFGGGSGTRQAAAYDYSFQYPDDWRQTGGNPQLWQTLVSPESAAPGTDVIAVQEGRLNYDAGAHRDQAVRDLRAEYDAKIAAGGHFSEFDGSATYGGKTVVSYREQLPQATADWFIVHHGQFQVSVGCQYTPQGRQDVQRACERVVRSLMVRGQ
jgi:molecular chaperone DnaK